MNKIDNLYLIGYASGLAGAGSNSGLGPIAVQQSSYLSDLIKKIPSIQWDEMIYPSQTNSSSIAQSVQVVCEQLAIKVSERIRQEKRITVLGGDHTCAIGTWSGAYDALHTKGDIGLIWLDAHMDSHTPETSESGRLHGMPLACLLGQGYTSLTHILNAAPKIKPENLCLIGVRSFERGEADFLKKLNVRIFFMDEVQQRGLNKIMDEAVALVSRNTIGYGLSIDLDGIDPNDAPGVDVPEPHGIKAHDLCEVLYKIASNKKLIAAEIVEYDPKKDIDRMTEKLIVKFLKIFAESL